MKKRFYLLLCFVVIACANVFAQDFFADEVQDTIPKKFYEQERSISLLYTLGLSNQYFGVTALIHNNNDRFSFYVSGRTNIQESYWMDGFSADSSLRVHHQSHFSEVSVTLGVGGAIKPNLLIYGAMGTVCKFSTFDSNMYNGVFFENKNIGYRLACEAGLLYITELGISFQGGVDALNKKLVLGVGYTF